VSDLHPSSEPPVEGARTVQDEPERCLCCKANESIVGPLGLLGECKGCAETDPYMGFLRGVISDCVNAK
jgi:hypothetical protein